jgi:hypothetical protein
VLLGGEQVTRHRRLKLPLIPLHPLAVLFLFMPASEIPRPNPTMTRTPGRTASLTPTWQSARMPGTKPGSAVRFSFAVGILHAAATVEIGDPSAEQR